MASFLSCTVVALLLVSALADQTQERDELMEQQHSIERKCSQQYKVPPNYFELYIAGTMKDSLNGKCFMKCGMSMMGYLNEDGTLNKDRVRYITQVYFDDKSFKDLAYNSWIECDLNDSGYSGDSSCDRAFRLAKCYFDKITEASKKKATVSRN